MTTPNTPTGQEPTATPTDQTSTAPGNPPPWERDGETFDAQRAWSLIENLRADLSAAKNTTSPATPAAPTPAPPAAPATADPAAPGLDDQVKALRLQLAHERVGRKYSLDDDLVGLLGSGTDAEIDARGQLLADRLGNTPAAPASPVTRRPVEQLRGGGNPSALVEETDPAKLADAIRARRPF